MAPSAFAGRYGPLRTARLHLRAPRRSDAAIVYARYGADLAVTRFTSWRPHACLEDAEAALEDRLGRLASGIEASWMLCPAGSDAPVGTISAWIEEEGAELGFVLARSVWGRGLATEAAIAVRDWALALEPVQRVWATCDHENRASARVLEKAGLVCVGRFERPILRPNLGPEPRDSLLFELRP
ncbi:MAG: GNAT family N-acetyltransferase [Pseudomonadales bacterium]|jgi:RimJ/RimL family protein N-acetyltransferase|nr:GNAT family N-acetyltransferase [Pseudomonadales bacterium]